MFSTYFKRISSLISAFCMVVSVSALASCESNGSDDISDDSGKLIISSDYVLVRPEEPTATEDFLAKKLKGVLEKQSGISLTISTDWLAPSETAPEKELLVGNTDRDESKAVYEKLGENEWAVTVSGNKIVIAGKGNKALTDAVNYFTDVYVSGKSAVELDKNDEKYDTSRLVYFSWKEDGETVKVTGGGSYPRLYQLSDGRLMCARDDGSAIRACYSSDGGLTWEANTRSISVLPQYTCANAAIIEMLDGEILVAYRALGNKGDKYYGGIHVSSSKDGGKTWKNHSTVISTENDGDKNAAVYEPHFIMMNGLLTVFYANAHEDYVKAPYQYLEYKQYKNGKWGNRTIVADGFAHKSRDGMPYVIQLSSGEYVCALEGWIPGTPQLMIKLIYSEDGKKWSEPIEIYRSSGTNAGAPAIAELPNGQLVLSFQTAEDCTHAEKRSDCAVMKTLISDGTPIQAISAENFTSLENTFGTPEGYRSKWNALYVANGYLYAATSTNHPASQISICRYPLNEFSK